MSLTCARGWLVVVTLALGCSGNDTTLERRGGPLPPEEASGGSDSGSEVSFCEALTVIRAKCQRCHQDPPLNNAPVPFLTYEDTQIPYDTELNYSEVMLLAVQRDFMPYLALNEGDDPIMPPVEALTSAEKATLLGWLKQGALPSGGTACP